MISLPRFDWFDWIFSTGMRTGIFVEGVENFRDVVLGGKMSRRMENGYEVYGGL